MADDGHEGTPTEADTPRPSAPDHVERGSADAADLRLSRDFLNLVIENIPAMVAVKDAKDLRFVLGNRHGDELTGNARSESLGKTDFDLFPKEQAEAFVALDREVLASGELRIIEEEPITTRKGTRYLRTLKMPVLDDEGKPRFLLAMSEDITERKLAEAALRTSEAKFRSLLNASPDAVMAIDEAGRIVLANEAFRAMYGYGPEELVGRPAAILAPPNAAQDDVFRTRAALAADKNSTSEIVQDLSGLRRDGTVFPTEVTLSELQSDQGRLIIVSIRDVTERKAVDTQLRQAQKMEAIGNLTGGLAHDFNNLLSVVIGNIDLLRERLAGDPEAEELASEALTAALRGADLTKRLLAFARRQPLEPRSVDVNELVADVDRLLSRLLGGNLDVRHRLAEDVWPIVADPVQLEACLVNLATNARDAMPRGGTLEIVTDNRHLDEDYATLYPGLVPGEYALIQLSDTGTGMSQETLAQIFEPFFTTKEEGRGTGLGLSMVFGFMKQSGGHINVYSELGRGTTFRLFFPRAGRDGLAVADSEPEDTIGTGGGETVLAVEDNPGLRQVVVRQLTRLGYQCIEAHDGNAAIGILESQKVDLLFTDVVMPGGMSGYELAREALERWPNLRVLMTSGFPDERQNGHHATGHGLRLLNKPYRKEDLARILREVLDSK